MTFDELRQAIDANGGPGDEIIAQVMAGEMYLFGGPEFMLVWYPMEKAQLKAVFFTGDLQNAKRCLLCALALGYSRIEWDARPGWARVFSQAMGRIAQDQGEGFEALVDVKGESHGFHQFEGKELEREFRL